VWGRRLKKAGTTFTGSYSSDGQTWTDLSATVANTAVATGAKVGVYTIGTTQSASKTVTFDYFHLTKGGSDEDETPPVTTATTDPEQPAGGTFTGPVSVTLKATDEAGGSGVDKTEYQLDGGGWTAYTAPVTVTGNGQHELKYRSADKAGNVEEAKTLTLTISAPAPQVKLTVSASSRCIGTSAYVAVTAVNGSDVPATVTLTTPFGSKTVADVAPGKQAYQSFNSRAGQIEAGTVAVKGTATIGGEQVTSSYDATYPALSCR
jgi:hypothetical protein